MARLTNGFNASQDAVRLSRPSLGLYIFVAALAVFALSTVGLSLAIAALGRGTATEVFGAIAGGMAILLVIGFLILRLRRASSRQRLPASVTTVFARNRWPLIERGLFVLFNLLTGTCIVLLGAATSDDSSTYSSGVVLVGTAVASIGVVLGIVSAVRALRANAVLALQDEGLRWVEISGKTHSIANASIATSSFILLRNGILDIHTPTENSSTETHKRLLLLDYGPNLATVASALDHYLTQNGAKLERVNRFR